MDNRIETARLVLRPLVRTDAERFSTLASNIAVSRMTGSFPHPFHQPSVEGLIDIFAARRATGKAHHWAITRDGELIGVIGFDRHGEAYEVGYWIGEPYWGQGYAFEALEAALSALRAAKPQAIITARVFMDNPASRTLLLKHGFADTGSVSQGYSVARDCRTAQWSFSLLPVGNAVSPRAERVETMIVKVA